MGSASDPSEAVGGTWVDADTVEGEVAVDASDKPADDDVPLHALSPGSLLGRYHVLDRLGRGGMGTVVEAYDPSLDRKIAIKVLHRGGHDREVRLLREAQALARLSHPNVVQVYEVGEVEGRLFIAMEMVQGQTLARWHADIRPWREVVQAYLQAGRGLAAAHAQGLVHRDFKPANCIIDSSGRVRVLDFGLARETDESDPGPATPLAVARLQAQAAEPASSSSNSKRALEEVLTQTGAMVGTMGYMGPEQLLGRLVDAKTDQFGFCVSLYEGLYGRRPFPSASIGALVDSVVSGSSRSPPAETSVPSAMWTVLRRGLARDPADRWPTMDDLLAQLDRRLRRRRRRWAVLAAGVGAAAGLGAWLGPTDSPTPCRGAADRMAQVWSETQAHAVQASVMATEVPYAAAAWSGIESSLDDYAQRWVQAHTSACEATSVHHRQSTALLDLRMQCLDERRASLRRTVELLESADAAVVERALPIVTGLPGLSRCDDVASLRAAVPPPDDPDIARRVSAANEQLAEIRTLILAHRTEQAALRMTELIDVAQALEHPPLLAAVKLERGTILEDQGKLDRAEQDIVEAYATAVDVGDGPTAAGAAERMAFLAGVHQAQPGAGRAWGITAEALAHREDPGGPLETRAIRSMAVVLASAGDFDEAEPRMRRVLEIHQADAGPNRLAVAAALNDLGNVETMRGHVPTALQMYRRAREIQEGELGPDHPMLLVSTLSLGHALQAGGDLEGALAEDSRGLELASRIYGDGHPKTALALNNMGVVLDQLGRHAQAAQRHRQAESIRRRALGPEHPHVAESAANLGMALRSMGDVTEALACFERSVAIFAQTGHPHLGRGLYDLAESLEQLGRLEQARVHRVRHLALVEPLVGEQPADVATAEFALALLLWDLGTERPRAATLARRAVEHFAAAGPPMDASRVEAEAWVTAHPLPTP